MTDLDTIIDQHLKWMVSGGREGARADLRNRDLRNRDLRGRALGGADFMYSDLRGANLEDAGLLGAGLQHVRLDGANMRGANLTGARLWGAGLPPMYSDLRGANLEDASLFEAGLQHVRLDGANMRGANLTGARLRGASLHGVNLHDALICRTDMQGAEGVVLAGPVGSAGRTIYAVDHYDHWMVHAGCWWGTVDDLEERIAPGGGHGWDDEADEDRWRGEYTAAIAFIRAVATVVEAPTTCVTCGVRLVPGAAGSWVAIPTVGDSCQGFPHLGPCRPQ